LISLGRYCNHNPTKDLLSNPTEKQPISHRKLAVIEADERTLDQLVVDPELIQHIWLRVGKKRLIIDSLSVPRVARVLERLGLPPRFVCEFPNE